MNKQNGKRQSISKKNSIEKDNIIIPLLINNKFLNESNIIVNEIIEKIISLVISTNFNKNIEKKLSLSSYNFIKNSLDTYLSSNFITHDKDETYQDLYIDEKSEIIQEIEPISKINDFSNIDGYNLNNNSRSKSNLKLDEQYYFNNYYHGENEWDLMDEPKPNKFDRYAATMVKFKEIEKEKEKGFKYINKNNAQVLEEVDEESEKNSINNNNINNEKSETNPSKIKENKKQNKYYYVGQNKNANKKKNMIEIMNQFSFHDLDDNNDVYIESNDINYEKLRKELQEKQKVDNEEKKIIKKSKIEVENKIKAENEKNRQYIGKKITTDVNGEIVFIKGIKLDKLNKEFLALKSNTKLIKDEEKENEKKVKKKKKPKEEIIKDDDKNKDKDKEETEKNKNNEKMKATKLLPKIKSNKNRSTLKDGVDDSKSRLLKRIEEGPIILSGSNFDIMNMEVGVSIKENEKYKTGGKDFYHKYNKYSITNYNKQLKETTEVNSFLKTHAEVENQLTKTDNNYISNYTETYNNSSIGFINNSNFNQQILNTKQFQLTNYNTLSNFGNKSTKAKDLQSTLSPRLKLTMGGGGSLLGSMEKLNLITERQERLAKKTPNIFKKNNSNYSSAKEIVLPKLEEINKFTSEILTSNNWMKKSGINNTIGSPFRNPEKPGFKEISREMGLKGKILRNRLKSNFQKKDLNPALEALDFFKNQ